MPEQMDNAIVYLLGHYGVGKLTVAKALCGLTGARLVDSHLMSNVVFSVIRSDGKTALPAATWDLIAKVREAALEAIETLAPAGESYVLTNALDDTPKDRAWYDRVVLMAERRGALFVPVVVTCDEAENARRIPSPEREANMKHTDVASALERRRTTVSLPVVHPNRMDLDTTLSPPEISAAAILRHVNSRR
jgi:hypothetical protein